MSLNRTILIVCFECQIKHTSIKVHTHGTYLAEYVVLLTTALRTVKSTINNSKEAIFQQFITKRWFLRNKYSTFGETVNLVQQEWSVPDLYICFLHHLLLFQTCIDIPSCSHYTFLVTS